MADISCLASGMDSTSAKLRSTFAYFHHHVNTPIDALVRREGNPPDFENSLTPELVRRAESFGAGQPSKITTPVNGGGIGRPSSSIR